MLLRRARYLEDSPFLHHLPFLFWLIDILRPRSIAQVGALDPVAYFAICQAMDKLNVEGHSFGIKFDGEIPGTTRNHNN